MAPKSLIDASHMNATHTSVHMSGAAQLRSFFLAGPAGRLEALLNEGDPRAPYSVLICHPHPKGGGTLHNKVVYHAMKAFQHFGLPVLRFNFRGTGLSEGEHNQGRGEVDDVKTALHWLEHQYGKPLLFCGFSFGANVGMRACCGDPRVRGIVALGLPVHAEGRDYRYSFLPGCTSPKLFVSGGADQYGPRDAVEAIVRTAAQPASLVWIPDADHFFAGKLPAMQDALRIWLSANFFPERLLPPETSKSETSAHESSRKD
jgi:alpha/beta superfamily hydrolase